MTLQSTAIFARLWRGQACSLDTTDLFHPSFSGNQHGPSFVTPRAHVPIEMASAGQGWLRAKSPFLLDRNEVEGFGKDWSSWQRELQGLGVQTAPGTFSFIRDAGGFRLHGLQRECPSVFEPTNVPELGDTAAAMEAARALMALVLKLDEVQTPIGLDPEPTHYSWDGEHLIYCGIFPPLASISRTGWYLERFGGDLMNSAPGAADPGKLQLYVAQRHNAAYALHLLMERLSELLPTQSRELHQFGARSIQSGNSPHHDMLLAALFGEVPNF